jgi:hypothetical protein
LGARLCEQLASTKAKAAVAPSFNACMGFI